MMLQSPVTASFDDPQAMLIACHGKVRHFAALLERLVVHVQAGGDAEQAKAAAEAILRYFDQAAPLHHQDEERDVFPAVLAHAPELASVLAGLEADHERLGRQWQVVRASLQGLCATGRLTLSPVEAAAFALAYGQHADAEERDVFARMPELPVDVLRTLGSRMAARRQQSD